jgi:hypothetical protein
MLFALSKILGFMIDPLNIIALLFLLGLILLLFKKYVVGTTWVFIGVALFFMCGLNVVPRYCISPLENRIPIATIPDGINGIIVLTGMVNTDCSRAGLIELSSSADRIINAVILAQKHPQATLVICGGTGSLMQNKIRKKPII